MVKTLFSFVGRKTAHIEDKGNQRFLLISSRKTPDHQTSAGSGILPAYGLTSNAIFLILLRFNTRRLYNGWLFL